MVGSSRFTRAQAILFRIFYSTSFTIVFLLTVGAACVGPIDIYYESWRRGRLIDIFSMAGVYLVVGLICTFLYASRLYTNRSNLRDIPKTYMPTDKADVGRKRVSRLIEDCRSRSAVIAYLARPRSRLVENELPYARNRISTLLKPEHSKKKHIFEPAWGQISHPGWTGPDARETPSLQYAAVVAELVDLIEARAVSLAPVSQTEFGLDEFDERIIQALQRDEQAGMRQYVAYLVDLGMLSETPLVASFLAVYERARFAPTPLDESEFKKLMRIFAEILRTMTPPDLTQVDYEDSDVASLGSQKQLLSASDAGSIRLGKRPTTNHVDTDALSVSSASSASIAGSVRHHIVTPPVLQFAPQAQGLPQRLLNEGLPPRMSNDSVRSVSSVSAYHDAEDTSWTLPTSRPPFFRAPSSHSTSPNKSRLHRRLRMRSKNRRAMSQASLDTSRTGSLKSARSRGSVIRLNPRYDGSRDQLPFMYTGHGMDNEDARHHPESRSSSGRLNAT